MRIPHLQIAGRLLVAAAGAAWLGPPAADAAPESPKTPAVLCEEAIALLREKGLRFDPAQLTLPLLRTLVRTADPSGRVMTEEDLAAFRAVRAGRVHTVDIGIEAGTGRAEVSRVPADGPAAAAGLLEGDWIDAIDGRPCAGALPGSVEAWLEGPAGEPVRLRVVREGRETPLDVEVPRTEQAAPAIRGAEAWPRDLAYLSLRGLGGGSAPEIVRTLRAWKEEGRFGVVVDLRGADGASGADAVRVAGLIADQAAGLPVFQDADGRADSPTAPEPEPPLGMAVMLLTDGATSGAAELLAAIVREVGRRAMLVGSPTAGDPLIREALPFSDDLYLYVATRRLVLPGGVTYAGREGVVPHLVVKPAAVGERAALGAVAEEGGAVLNRNGKTLEQEAEDRELRDRVRTDPPLQRAVDILLGLKALDVEPLGRTPDISR